MLTKFIEKFYKTSYCVNKKSAAFFITMLASAVSAYVTCPGILWAGGSEPAAYNTSFDSQLDIGMGLFPMSGTREDKAKLVLPKGQLAEAEEKDVLKYGFFRLFFFRGGEPNNGGPQNNNGGTVGGPIGQGAPNGGEGPGEGEGGPNVGEVPGEGEAPAAGADVPPGEPAGAPPASAPGVPLGSAPGVPPASADSGFAPSGRDEGKYSDEDLNSLLNSLRGFRTIINGETPVGPVGLEASWELDSGAGKNTIDRNPSASLLPLFLGVDSTSFGELNIGVSSVASGSAGVVPAGGGVSEPPPTPTEEEPLPLPDGSGRDAGTGDSTSGDVKK